MINTTVQYISYGEATAMRRSYGFISTKVKKVM